MRAGGLRSIWNAGGKGLEESSHGRAVARGNHDDLGVDRPAVTEGATAEGCQCDPSDPERTKERSETVRLNIPLVISDPNGA